jgi:hypothetical protein
MPFISIGDGALYGLFSESLSFNLPAPLGFHLPLDLHMQSRIHATLIIKIYSSIFHVIHTYQALNSSSPRSHRLAASWSTTSWISSCIRGKDRWYLSK